MTTPPQQPSRSFQVRKYRRIKLISSYLMKSFKNEDEEELHRIATAVFEASMSLMDRFFFKEPYVDIWIVNGTPPDAPIQDIRRVEAELRHAGLSRAKAKRICNRGIR